MEKAMLLQKLAHTEEDRILLARIYDRIENGRRRNVPASTCFLSPREQRLAEQLFPGDPVIFFGGTKEAERAVCCYLPPYASPEELYGADSPIAAARASFFRGDRLTHRDILGSLMACGIKRETVGDIYVGEGQCDFFVTREILPYLLEEYRSAGKTALHLTELPFEEVTVPEEDYRIVKTTISSLRLDSVLSAGFGISRSKAAAAVEAGSVFLNDLPCEKPDHGVEQGDKLTLRGSGKLRLAEVGGKTRKDRIGVEIHRYG